MNLVQNQNSEYQIHQNEIIASIQLAMRELGQSVQLQPWTPPTDQEYQRIRHVTQITFKQLSETTKLLWEFKILSHVLIIKVTLLDQQTLSHQIKSLCRKHRQKVIYYFIHINNISFSQNEGEFYVHGDSKIVYQYREDNWYALKNPFKLRHHLQKKLKKISDMFSKSMESFLMKFKLIPNLEYQKKHLEKIEYLNQLKLFFQQNKKNPSYPPQTYHNMLQYRKNATILDSSKVGLLDKNLLTLIQCKLPSDHKSFDRNSPNIPSFEELKYKFKSKITQYTNFAQYNDIMYPLVIAMQVIDVKNQTALKEKGGFGQITRGLYSCKYGKTIYEDINRQLQSENYFSEQIFNRYLCKKSSLSQHCEAFENQKQALLKLRNKKSPHIAQYYCNLSKGKPFDDGNIYMDVYASNIDQIPIKLKHKFKILMEIIKGLSFLNSNGILHRDMKPQNVVVDRQMNSKIIDFGSCSNVFQRQDLFKPYDIKRISSIIMPVRSTKGYFVKYETYQSTIGKKCTPLGKKEFYQHYFFDIYSYGKIIQKLFNLSEYEFVHEDLLMSQINYLFEKCCEINPADRLAHEEIQFFLQNVIRLEKQTLS